MLPQLLSRHPQDITETVRTQSSGAAGRAGQETLREGMVTLAAAQDSRGYSPSPDVCVVPLSWSP